jgi:hypothetical protein
MDRGRGQGIDRSPARSSAAANGDERLVWSYLDNKILFDRTATATLAGITADSYDVYVYFGSDNPDRRGTVGVSGGATYSYKTVQSWGSFSTSQLDTR